MSLIQLKPQEQFWLQMCKNLTRRFRVMILCEGKRDAEVLKALVGKLEIPLRGNIGITDCGGIPAIKDVAIFVATLARLSRKLAKIAVIVDADTHTFDQKAGSIIDSLKANKIDIKETRQVAESLHNAKTEKLDILIQIAGIKDLPFQKHTIDDYIVQLLLLEGKIEDKEIKKAREAKEIVDEQEEDAKTIIENTEREKVEQAFRNIMDLLKVVASTADNTK